MEEKMVIGSDIDSGEKAYIDCSSSQRILICGKTGTGKSYTLGVLIEEICRKTSDIVLLVDPQGVFWTMSSENTAENEIKRLWDFDLYPKGFNINLLVPGDPKERYGGEDIIDELERRNIKIQSLRVNPSDLAPEMWCELFDLDINELMGILLFKAVRQCSKQYERNFFIDEIIAELSRIPALDKTKEAVERKLEMAKDWQIFEEEQYREIWEILLPDAINILDLSIISQGRYGLRNLVIAVIAEFIFRKRTIARRREELNLGTDFKKVWMAIDEAHNFCPSGKSTLSKEILIRWAKEGRQPGLSLLVASQQPSAIDSEILTQCGIRLVHKITSRDDFKAVDALSQDYLGDGLVTKIRRLTGPGQLLLIDDQGEFILPILVRPRQSSHGGKSA